MQSRIANLNNGLVFTKKRSNRLGEQVQPSVTCQQPTTRLQWLTKKIGRCGNGCTITASKSRSSDFCCHLTRIDSNTTFCCCFCSVMLLQHCCYIHSGTCGTTTDHLDAGFTFYTPHSIGRQPCRVRHRWSDTTYFRTPPWNVQTCWSRRTRRVAATAGAD